MHAKSGGHPPTTRQPLPHCYLCELDSYQLSAGMDPLPAYEEENR